LKQGMTSTDVMNLQKVLNMNAVTQVAATGVGSAGNESTYFGAKTKAAVVKFQELYAADILTPVGLTAGNGFVGAGTRAKLNAVCAGSTGTGTGTGTTTGTGVTVSSATQPGNSLAVYNAARVPFTKFTLTNNSGAAQTVTGVTVELTGLASVGSFSKVLLLDENGAIVGNEQVLGSSRQATVGGTFTVAAGETRTFTVAANVAASPLAGEVASFSVVAINTTATVAGSLPITGAQHTVNATFNLGTVTADRGSLDPNGSQSKEIGTTDYRFTSVKLTAGTNEDILVNGIRFNQSGSASASDLTNVKVTVDGTAYTPTMSADGKYFTVMFPGGLRINQGFSKEFTVSGDILSGTARTVSFDVYRLTDILVTGVNYGYGITPTAGTGFSSIANPTYNGSDVTIQGGSFNSVSKSNTVSSGNIASLVSDEKLGAFTVDLKGEGVQVQTLVVNVAGAAADESITLAKLVDQNGVTLAGPVDGATQTTTLTFSNVTFPVGITTVTVVGRLDAEWDATDTVTLSTNPSTDWSGVTGSITGNSVTLPNSTATANAQTVKAASLVATTLANEPAVASVVAGAQNKVLAVIALDASASGENIRVTSMKVTDTPASGAKAYDIDNVELFADLDKNGSYETRISNAEQFTTSVANTAETLTIVLSTPVTVAKNETIKVAVIADVASNATSGTHTVNADTTSASVVAVGANTGVTASATPTGVGQTQTIATVGALTSALDASDATSPVVKMLLDNTVSAQTIGVLQFTASNVEDVNVETVKLTATGTNNNNVVATYELWDGTNLVASKANTASTVTFGITGSTLFAVEKNESKTIVVKAKMANIDGSTIVNGNTVIVGIAAAGDVTAKGKDSNASVAVTGTATAATRTVYEAYPTVAFDNTGVNTALVANAEYLAGKIKITNVGDKEIKFNTGASAAAFKVEAFASGFTVGAVAGTLKAEDGTVLVSDTTWADGSITGDFLSPFVISKGESRTISVYLNTTGSDGSTGGSDSVYLRLNDDAAGNVKYNVGTYATAISEGTNVFKNDIYGPTHTRN